MATVTKTLITDQINGIAVNASIKCSSSNYTNFTGRDVKYVVMHYTGNAKDTAKANCTYFSSGSRSASAHLFVDETSVYQSVELCDSAWHCGCSAGYKTACRNTNSIGIEMCCSSNYRIADITQINAAYVCAYICKLIGITANAVDTYVLRHYDVVASNKKCPAPMVADPALWTNFKTMVKHILTTGSHTGTAAPAASSDTAAGASASVPAPNAAAVPSVSVPASNATAVPSASDTTSSISKLKVPSDIRSVQTWLNTYYKAGLTTDGIYGAKTKAALIKAWQTEAGGLTADGIFGAASKARSASVIIKKGSTGSLVTVWQAYLVCRKYQPNGIDGIFGAGCHAASLAFQKANNLTQDGIIGPNTWTKAFAS